MNTFLPYPEFDKSAKVLDYRRLGKQRAECLQLLDALRIRKDPLETNAPRHIVNHPCTKMWKNYEVSLIVYLRAIINEWLNRGYEDNSSLKLCYYTDVFGSNLLLPPWLGDENFHTCHRVSLLMKDYVYYCSRLECSKEERVKALLNNKLGRPMVYLWPTEVI